MPSGWLGDVFGPREGCIRIVLWWSVFTALTGLVGVPWAAASWEHSRSGALVVTPLATLIVMQFIFGMGEAGTYPNITRALHNWFPSRERGFTQGAVWMCGRLMGGLTPLVWMLLVEGMVRSASQAGGPAAALLPLDALARRRSCCLRRSALVGAVFAVWFRDRRGGKTRASTQAELA